MEISDTKDNILINESNLLEKITDNGNEHKCMCAVRDYAGAWTVRLNLGTKINVIVPFDSKSPHVRV